MKYLAAVLMILAPAVAQACPPTNQHPAAVAERERVRREYIERADGIVYASVSSDIRADRGGMIRILHVYRGNFQAGQRVRMVYDASLSDCYVHMQPRTVLFSRGQYGIVILHAAGERGFASPGFINSAGAEQLIRDGFIESARGSSAGSEQ